MAFVRAADDPAPLICEATWEGSIGFERRGNGGFDDRQHLVVDGVERGGGQPAFCRDALTENLEAIHRLALALDFVLRAVQLRVALEVP
jgi:hypothetical protein